MVAVVLPFLKFAPPVSGMVNALALAQAGSAAPAAGAGGLATLTAVTTSAADAGSMSPAASKAPAAVETAKLRIGKSSVFWTTGAEATLKPLSPPHFC